jgi:hypothetical protein
VMITKITTWPTDHRSTPICKRSVTASVSWAWPVGNCSCRRVGAGVAVPFARRIFSARQGTGKIRCNVFLRDPGLSPTLFLAPNPAYLVSSCPSLLPAPRPARDPAPACTRFRVCSRLRYRALASGLAVPAGGFAVDGPESIPLRANFPTREAPGQLLASVCVYAARKVSHSPE